MWPRSDGEAVDRDVLTLDAMTVVAKLGSSIVAGEDGALRTEVLDSVCAQVAELHAGGENVVMVTSGAIARGREREEDEEEERKKRFAKKGRRVSLAHGRRPTCTTSKRAKWEGGEGN